MHRSRLTLPATVVGSVALLLTHAAPAHAATVVATGIPEDWQVLESGCDGATIEAGTVTTVAGPKSPAPPLGSGSMRLRQVDEFGVVGLERSVPSFSELSDFAVRVLDPDGATLGVVDMVIGADSWQGQTALGPAEGWTLVDLRAKTYAWYQPNSQDPEITYATIDEFVEQRGDHAGEIAVLRAGCATGAGPGDAFIDGLTFGLSGESTTYDFESATQEAQLTIKVADDTLRRGDNVVVTGKVSPALPGSTILLRRKTDDGPKRFGSGVVAKDGSYKIVKELGAAGTYRLFTVVPATETTTAGRSQVVTVTVRR